MRLTIKQSTGKFRVAKVPRRHKQVIIATQRAHSSIHTCYYYVCLHIKPFFLHPPVDTIYIYIYIYLLLHACMHMSYYCHSLTSYWYVPGIPYGVYPRCLLIAGWRLCCEEHPHMNTTTVNTLLRSRTVPQSQQRRTDRYVTYNRQIVDRCSRRWLYITGDHS